MNPSIYLLGFHQRAERERASYRGFRAIFHTTQKDFVIELNWKILLHEKNVLPPGTLDKFATRIGRSRVPTINFIAHALIADK